MDGWMDGWMNGWMDGWIALGRGVFTLYVVVAADAMYGSSLSLLPFWADSNLRGATSCLLEARFGFSGLFYFILFFSPCFPSLFVSMEPLSLGVSSNTAVCCFVFWQSIALICARGVSAYSLLSLVYILECMWGRACLSWKIISVTTRQFKNAALPPEFHFKAADFYFVFCWWSLWHHIYIKMVLILRGNAAVISSWTQWCANTNLQTVCLWIFTLHFALLSVLHVDNLR